MPPAASRLTADDRRIIARARALAALPGTAAIEAYTGKADVGEAFAVALGRAQVLLACLADIAERLGGGNG
jgi:hypothetical protein